MIALLKNDQRKLLLMKKTCEENVESAIEVFLEEASSVNSCQKNIINEIIDVTIIILSINIVNLDLKPSHCQKKLKIAKSQQQQQQNRPLLWPIFKI